MYPIVDKRFQNGTVKNKKPNTRAQAKKNRKNADNEGCDSDRGFDDVDVVDVHQVNPYSQNL